MRLTQNTLKSLQMPTDPSVRANLPVLTLPGKTTVNPVNLECLSAGRCKEEMIIDRSMYFRSMAADGFYQKTEWRTSADATPV